VGPPPSTQEVSARLKKLREYPWSSYRAKVRGEDWNDFAERWGDPGAALAMWVARRCTGLTLCEIGEGIGGRDYAAVAMAIRRVDSRLSRDRVLRAQATQICEVLNVKMSPR